MLTKETLDELINNSEYSDCIKDAAPHRVKIIEECTPKMKELQEDYLAEMIKADYKDVSRIMAKLKLDKKDLEAKAEYAKWKKNVMNEFRATLNCIHPNENQTPSVGMVYAAGKMLKYINRTDIIDAAFEDKSIIVNFKSLEDTNAYFKSKDVRDVMIDIFQQADEVQGMICENADKIKYDYYEMLPAEVRYDSKTNKHGLKQANFCALVKHKAMGLIKDMDKYTKYINAQLENNNNNIDRECIMVATTKNM